MKAIEEKAKAYDEALERAKRLLKDTCGKGHYDPQWLCEEIFTQLANEDEKKLNYLHSWMKEFGGAEEYTEEVYRWLKGLIEKQGEQKSINEKAVFEVGETITDGTSTFTITDIVDEHYIADDGDKVCFYVAHKYYTLVSEQKLVEWSEEDEKMRIYACKFLDDAKHEIRYNEPHKIDIDNCISWLKSLKDRCLPQPKQEWSEEDEDVINKIIGLFQYSESFSASGITNNDTKEVDNWLKSLRPQKQWKPSEEQLQALSEAKDDCCGETYEILDSLLRNLKEL